MGENLLAVETSDRAEVGYRTGAKLKEQDCSPPQKGRTGKKAGRRLLGWKTGRLSALSMLGAELGLLTYLCGKAPKHASSKERRGTAQAASPWPLV